VPLACLACISNPPCIPWPLAGGVAPYSRHFRNRQAKLNKVYSTIAFGAKKARTEGQRPQHTRNNTSEQSHLKTIEKHTVPKTSKPEA
jgi:hypothetical protein